MRSSIFNFKFDRQRVVGRRINAWFLVLAVTGASIVLLGSGLIRYLHEQNPDKMIYRRARESLGPETEIVALGASLVRSGIRPSILSRPAVIFAPNGADYRALHMVLKANIHRMKSVRWALIELDNICLHYDRVNPTADLGELYDLGVRNHHLNVGGMERLARWLKDNSVIYPLLYLPRLNPASMFADRQQKSIQTEPGFMTFTYAMTPEILASRSLDEDEQLLGSPAREANLKALYQIVELLEDRGVTILWLRLPQNRPYYDARSSLWRARESALIESVRQKMGEKFILLDLRLNPEFNTSMFCDTRHLNVRGAEVFSRMLDAWMIIHLPGFQRHSVLPSGNEAHPLGEDDGGFGLRK